MQYLALIHRARGLYGRILTELVSRLNVVRSIHTTKVKILPAHTDRLSSVNEMFIS